MKQAEALHDFGGMDGHDMLRCSIHGLRKADWLAAVPM